MDLIQAKSLLNLCTRMENKDHVFGDREITWLDVKGIEVATGYIGSLSSDVMLFGGKGMFYGDEAHELSSCGEHVISEHGQSTYVDGVIVGELALEAVYRGFNRSSLNQQNGFNS